MRDAVQELKELNKEFFRGVTLRKKTAVNEVARIGWTLSRQNYITITKIAIPLTFLTFLNYYSLFFSYDVALRQIGILTTTFLSGIALYFSAESPQPLRLTTMISFSYGIISNLV